MDSIPRILAFAGSARADSYNYRLVKVAAQGAQAAGADATIVDLRDYRLPLFDQDLEAAEGLPAKARELKEIMLNHDGLLIAAPEYNSSITPLLKNTIDWVSRPSNGENALIAYEGKVAAIMSASPGRLGGLRGLTHLRSILSNIGVLVIPDQVAVGEAHKAFGPDGNFVDEKIQESVKGLGKDVTKLLNWNRCPEPFPSQLSSADCKPFERAS
ncbi:MAG: NAD(P)H-dependent oxidoreductase [Gammaproteobacteria bacterium]